MTKYTVLDKDPIKKEINNADAGFDAKSFWLALESHQIIANVCPNPRNGEPAENYLFDEELYKERFVIERTDAWMDEFRSILNRFDTTVSSWKGWNYLAFAVVFLKNKFTNHKSLNEFIMKDFIKIIILLSLMTFVSCEGNKADRKTVIENERQDSIARVEIAKKEAHEKHVKDSIQEELKRVEQARQDSIRIAEENERRLQAEREAKVWKGVGTLSQFKSKLPGTTWGTTTTRGHYYFKYNITSEKIYITAYLTEDFDERSRVGEEEYETIDRWYENSHGYFTIQAYSDRDMEKKREGLGMFTVPTELCFKKDSSTAIWATIDGGIRLKQIIE